MDHMMPVMDGIETVKKIRELGYTHTIIALTADAIMGQQEFFLVSGFDGYISKPIVTEELEKILEEWLPSTVRVYRLEAERR
jgi:CheY-like chemotaxis protein